MVGECTFYKVKTEKTGARERERQRETETERETHTDRDTHRERVITVKKTTYLNEKYFPLKRKRYHYKEL